MYKLMFLLAAAVVLASSAGAQTKFSAKIVCQKGAPSYTIPVSDKPGHALGLTKEKCVWSGAEIGGVAAKTGVSVYTIDSTSAGTTTVGYHTSTLASGDTWTSHFEGAAKLDKSGNATSGEGKFTVVNGTGKLTGIRGSGSYKGVANPDGSVTYDVEGDYILAAAK